LLQYLFDYGEISDFCLKSPQTIAWEPWLLFMLDVVTESAYFTRNYIIAIHRLMQDALGKAHGEMPGRGGSRSDGCVGIQVSLHKM